MNLHLDTKAFQNAILAASQGLKILPVFIKKDYWITLVLKRLSDSKYVNSVVFKGGTSLSKGFKLINRFSEDVDIAVLNASELSGNQLKTLIRTVEKEVAQDLKEKDVAGVTSKGSRFRKAVYQYPDTQTKKAENILTNIIIVEINSFANPYPYNNRTIQSLIGEHLQINNQFDLIQKYRLQSFQVNVLDKNQTLLEKIVSLLRFSLAEDYLDSLSAKVRHFYDIHYLLRDSDCNVYFNSGEFAKNITGLIRHDRDTFDDPEGWQEKSINQSPLLQNFDSVWNNLKAIYVKELSNLVFTEIPDEKEIAESFKKIVAKLGKNDTKL